MATTGLGLVISDGYCFPFVDINQISFIHVLYFSTIQCIVGEAVRRTLEYISSGKPKIMFLGPGCSKAAMPVAEAIHYWNVVQVSLIALRS